MGGKRAGARKQLRLCLALLIFLSGCSLVEEARRREAARESMSRGQQLLAQGQYDGSLEEFQKVLTVSGERPPADAALFSMALVHAHSANPKRDYRKALALLQKLQSDHPRSPWVEQAKVWTAVLQLNEKLAQANAKLAESNDKLLQANDRLIQANEKLNQVIEKSRQIDLEIEEKKRGKGR